MYDKKGNYLLESEDRKLGKTKKLKKEEEEAEAAASPPAKAARAAPASGSGSRGLNVLAAAAVGASPEPPAAAASSSSRRGKRPQLARMDCARPAGVRVDPGPAGGSGPSGPPNPYAEDYEIVSESSSGGVEDEDVDVDKLDSSDGD